MLRLARKFVSHVVPSVIRPLHILWNELMAFIFSLLAVMGGMWVLRQIRRSGPPDTIHDLAGLAVGVVFTLIMAYFAVSSWWKARSISRS